MADKILSQEEIDALLESMAKGEVDLDEAPVEASPSEIKPYDLTAQSIMLRDQFYALEELNDKFSNLLHNAMSTMLQRGIEIEYVSTEMIKYGDLIQVFTSPTSFSVFSMEPLIGSAMIALEPKLVFSLIDCMFGGEGRTVTRIREFTQIEQRLTRKFVTEVMTNLEKAWEAICPIRVSLKRTETKPEFVHLVAPNDLVINIMFVLKGANFSGKMHICISYLMLEPIKDKFSSRYMREKDLEHSWNREIRRLLRDTQVKVVAELGRVTSSVKELVHLQYDDVIRLDSGPEDLIRVMVEGVPKYLGVPGAYKGNRAVQIVERILKEGEKSQHGHS